MKTNRSRREAPTKSDTQARVVWESLPLVRRLEVAAGAELFLGCHAAAEALSRRAQALREAQR